MKACHESGFHKTWPIGPDVSESLWMCFNNADSGATGWFSASRSATQAECQAPPLCNGDPHPPTPLPQQVVMKVLEMSGVK